ncbi:MAG: AAA family ATPase [Lachnospiraceae bacterium]|nr:AAA family ATPase [Lachnospiraceae bacterium]
MIRYIKLQNYRSFTDLTIDFMSKNGFPLKFVVLYGENGSGKSNLINMFETLYDTTQTMSIRNMLMHLLEENQEPDHITDLASLKQYMDITRIIRANKTIGSIDNMIMEIGFQLEGKNGIYYIEFDNDQIIKEQLEFTIEKNKGIYYQIDKKRIKINNKIFGDYREEYISSLRKFWGKHSALAILFNAKDEFSDSYFSDTVNPYLLSVLKYIQSICVYMADNNSMRGIINTMDTLSPEMYTDGEISVSDECKIDHTEQMLNKFFQSTYRDIKKVFYKKSYTNTTLSYELYFTRFISGKERSVSFVNESCGTRNLIYLLPYCIAVSNNHVVAIDEIDNGIHDILLLNLVKALYQNINGQLLITTHNTMLLNEYEFKDSFFFIEIDENGKRRINTPSDFGYRIQPESNVVVNYLHDRFKGLPWRDMDVDFHYIAENNQ